VPDPVDLVVHHVGLLIKAALNAHATGWCADVQEFEPYQGAPQPKFPCLSVWVEGEKPNRQGTGARRTRVATLKAMYELGPVQVGKIKVATATVREAMQYVDSVLEDENLSTYESGQGLGALASVRRIGVTDIRYQGGKEQYPHAVLTIECEHDYERGSAGYPLTDILGTFELDSDLGAVTFEYDTGKDMILTPEKLGVIFMLQPGPVLGVVVTWHTVVVTYVANTTTLTNVAAAVAAEAPAAALLTVTGDAGTIPAALGTVVFGLSRPIAKQSSTTT